MGNLRSVVRDFRGYLLIYLILIGISIALILVGVWFFQSPVTCDGAVMRTGDTCVSYSGERQLGTSSYAEMRSQRDNWGGLLMVAGGLGILGPPLVIGAAVLGSRWSQAKHLTPRRGVMAGVMLGVLLVAGALLYMGLTNAPYRAVSTVVALGTVLALVSLAGVVASAKK